MHFTPTSASWLTMVERFFRDLSQNRLRRGVFRGLEELILPSELTSIAITTTLSPSSGPHAPPISWRRSRALAAHCINVNLHDALH
jgi:hypothetical protein